MLLKSCSDYKSPCDPQSERNFPSCIYSPFVVTNIGNGFPSVLKGGGHNKINLFHVLKRYFSPCVFVLKTRLSIFTMFKQVTLQSGQQPKPPSGRNFPVHSFTYAGSPQEGHLSDPLVCIPLDMTTIHLFSDIVNSYFIKKYKILDYFFVGDTFL